MLQSIRDHTQGWIAGIIVSLLILSFALWGIHSYFGGASVNPVVAKVDGVEITQYQLMSVYDKLRQQLQLQLKSTQPFSPKMELRLKEDALQDLVNTQILKQASIERQFRISSNQISDFISQMPDFQVNGQFSHERFQQKLNAARMDDFLDWIKTRLLIDQPRLGFILTAFVPSNEMQNRIELIKQKREFQYLILDFDVIPKKDILISTDQVQAYYHAHQQEFKTPERVSVEYITLSLHNLIETIHPTDDQLKQFFVENNGYSKELTQLDKTKDSIKQDFIHQKAEEKFVDLREKLANLTYEHPDSLQFAADSLGLTIKSTDLFSKEKGEGIAENAKVREAAFSNDILNLKNNSDVIQIGEDTILVLRLKTHQSAALLPLKAVENQIKEKLILAQLELKAQHLTNEIKEKLQNGSTLQEIAQQYHISWKQSGLIGRDTNKIDSAILNKAFSIFKPQHDKKFSYATVKTSHGFAIIALSAVHQNLPNQDHENYQKVSEQIQNMQGLMEYEFYKGSLMQHAKVVIKKN